MFTLKAALSIRNNIRKICAATAVTMRRQHPRILDAHHITKLSHRLHRQLHRENKIPTSLIRKLKITLCKSNLFLSNTLIQGVLMAVGDCVEQLFNKYKQNKSLKKDDFESLNSTRIWHAFAVGMLVGAMYHIFYGWMDRRFPKTNISNIGNKIILDQLIMAPSCILTYFYFTNYLQDRSLKEANNELKDKFVDTYIMDLTIWPVTQYINYTCIPSQFRVAFINVWAVIYCSLLAYMKHTYQPKHNEQPKQKSTEVKKK